jgi:GNAT superfamily N-acetyltransferase
VPADLHFTHLVDVPEAIPVLVRWFIAEWEPYYGQGGPGDADRDLTACCNRDETPLALVALTATGEVVGTAALKPHSLDTHRHLGPWMAALLVAREQRGKGIASALVTAVEGEARRLGFATLYSDTASSSSLLSRRGWQALEAGVPTLREPATVYRLDLGRA